MMVNKKGGLDQKNRHHETQFDQGFTQQNDNNFLQRPHFSGVGESMQVVQKTKLKPQFPFERKPISIGELELARLTPKVIVEDFLYANVCIKNASGGTGKTTIAIFEMAHIAIGRALYGKKVVSAGKVVLFTSEDSRERVVALLNKIIEPLQITDAEQAMLLKNFEVVDFSALGYKLTQTIKDIELTSLSAEIVDRYRNEEVSLIVFDPLVSFGANESAVNSNEQALIQAARRIVFGLNCCVQYIHHTGQMVDRAKISDQYAGRGGSALADGARSVQVLHRYERGKNRGRLPEPPRQGEEVIEYSRPKHSYGKPPRRLFLYRKGFEFRHRYETLPKSQELERQELKDRLVRFVSQKLDDGVYLNKSSIEAGYKTELNTTRELLRVALNQVIAEGCLHELEASPELKKQGIRKYLNPNKPKTAGDGE